MGLFCVFMFRLCAMGSRAPGLDSRVYADLLGGYATR